MDNIDYCDVYNSATIGLWRTTIADGKFLIANALTLKILGYDSLEDLQTKKASNLYDRKKFIEELTELQEIKDFEARMSKKDGTQIWVAICAKIYPEKGYIEGSIQDISEKKRQEDIFIPHLEKIFSLKECIMNRLQNDQDYLYESCSNRSLKTI